MGTPGWRRVLVLAAHPDDECIGAAGSLALLADEGATVTALFATDGEATRGSTRSRAATAALRRAEARAACAILGVGDTRHLGLADGGLSGSVRPLAEALGSAFADLAPEAVMLPWWLDGHPDHRAMSSALVLAEAPAATPVWAYETWTPLPANRLVDVSAVIERKRRALAEHKTAHLAFDVGAMLGLNRWRSIHGLMGVGYAEAFIGTNLGGYRELMARFGE